METPSNNKQPIILLFVFVAIIVILIKAPDTTRSTTPTSASSDTDYYMNDYTIVSTDTEGKAQYWFTGKEMKHYPNKRTYIDNPTITIRNLQKQIWTTHADAGEIADNEELTLDGNIEIEQVNINHPHVKINTDQLVISLHEKIASNESEVNVRMDIGHLNATGMHLDFANNQVLLKSKVSAKYVAD